jgi:hypothetical protein
VKVFTMEPQAVVWDLPRTLVRAQSNLVGMRNAAEFTKSVADEAPEERAALSSSSSMLKPVGTPRHCR